MNGLVREKTVWSAGLSALCAGVMVGGGALLLTTGAAAQDPPGNNGTVKIDDQPINSIPNNNPHVGCEFRVDFYGFDEGVGDAAVIFEMQAPTKDVDLLVDGDTTPDIGQDAAGGGNDLDASVTYKLSFDGQPHPQQGFHVKLTVNAPGSKGKDTKHKVFWVEGCKPTPPTETTPTETTPTETTPTETTPTGTPPTETTPTETTPSETPATETTPTGAPPTETPPTGGPPTQAPPTDFPAGVGAADVGGADGDSASLGWLAAGLIGSGAVLAGGAAFALRRRGDH